MATSCSTSDVNKLIVQYSPLGKQFNILLNLPEQLCSVGHWRDISGFCDCRSNSMLSTLGSNEPISQRKPILAQVRLGPQRRKWFDVRFCLDAFQQRLERLSVVREPHSCTACLFTLKVRYHRKISRTDTICRPAEP